MHNDNSRLGFHGFHSFVWFDLVLWQRASIWESFFPNTITAIFSKKRIFAHTVVT